MLIKKIIIKSVVQTIWQACAGGEGGEAIM